MVEKIEMHQTRDGKTFKYRNAANLYEKGLTLNEEIESLPIPAKAQEYMKKNWDEIRRLVRNSGGTSGYINPGMEVPDVKAPSKALKQKKRSKN